MQDTLAQRRLADLETKQEPLTTAERQGLVRLQRYAAQEDHERIGRLLARAGRTGGEQ